jgi:ComF family protein
VCTARFASPVHRCARCAEPLPATLAPICGACLRAPPPFTSALAAVDYAYPWDRLVTDFKFNGALDLADSLTSLLVAAHRQRAAVLPDLMLPVPLGSQRLHERGYNQSWELARRCANQLGCDAQAALLLRIKETAHQLALPRARRAANVRGAFAIEPTRRTEVQGRHIALIDDVMTTQATASEASRVMLEAGAASVQVWVVARTPRPGD